MIYSEAMRNMSDMLMKGCEKFEGDFSQSKQPKA